MKDSWQPLLFLSSPKVQLVRNLLLLKGKGEEGKIKEGGAGAGTGKKVNQKQKEKIEKLKKEYAACLRFGVGVLGFFPNRASADPVESHKPPSCTIEQGTHVKSFRKLSLLVLVIVLKS